ncbi:MAG TPA: hypothetical protein VLK65_02865 [Vicinamibacteria bacterium]|nr:hypothetical protein [Vicinamibacteria bacterium]
MKTQKVSIFVAAVLLAMSLPVRAQFDSGSDGSDGVLTVASGQTVTLDIPDDGVFNFTTVTIDGTLQFNRNPRTNAPPILLAQGDIIININGAVHVNGFDATAFLSGAGGPGGFDGGQPGIAGGDPGAGHGPGAGGPGIGSAVGGNAGYGSDPIFSDFPTDGVAYGSPLLVPLVGGSGGGGDDNRGGGGGGGAILFSSTTQVIHNGGIQAIGGSTFGAIFSHGSGGAIRIVTPFLSGSGSFSILGGGGGFGGDGRIRLDVIDRTGLTSNLVPSGTSVGSFMAVFPDVVRRLDIVHVAGNNIPEGTPSPILFVLPFGSPATQPVTVRASGFTGLVPISIVLTPDSGERIVVDAELDADAMPPELTINVDFPQNVATRVHAWTR